MIKVREWLAMTPAQKDSYLVRLFLRTWRWKMKVMTRRPSTRFPFGGDFDPFGEEE